MKIKLEMIKDLPPGLWNRLNFCSGDDPSFEWWDAGFKLRKN